ncbi:alpha/beta hydrolase [Kitasatospora sp. NPDC056446]|uniref:alpha/beta hydrolase n=1 Tax=Kitasatospora sp. NPDC056446 TaxID=3345819 RepID=UPI003692E6D2
MNRASHRSRPAAGPHRIRAARAFRAARRLGTAGAVAALLAAVLPGPALAASEAASEAVSQAAVDAAPVPRLDWTGCAEGFECATARVPLDYHAPRGEALDLAVIRHPAADPAHRIGSLFYNPGGPAVPGTQALPAMLTLFPEEVRARFDIVSFDPRGTGGTGGTDSTGTGSSSSSGAGVLCFDDPAQEQALLAGTAPGYPEGADQQRAWADGYRRLGRQCAARNPALLPHLSTANTARDTDLLRRAVGDRQLSYLGTSYGTYLGATYANLFPGRVRAMVLDSAMDPVAWSTGRGGQAAAEGTLLRNGNDLAAGRVLDAFLDRCGEAGPAGCAFSAGTAADTRARFTDLLQRLRARPVAALGTTFTAGSAVEATIVSLYAANPVPGLPGTGWGRLGAALQALWAATEAPAAPLPPVVRQSPDQALAVVCSDSANPPARADYPALAALARSRSGAVGPYFAWADERCADWPARDRDRYDGPWNHRTARPVLVVANTGDPGMPYEGSRAMARSLARAELLTVDGYGHTVLANPSACAARYETRYLVDGTLPAHGTVCAPDREPFSG